MERAKQKIVWNLLRISVAIIFLWAFLDKTFGLGYATEPSKSWLMGNSPTTGFLKFGTHGLFADYFQLLAGNVLVDWLFMLGLLFVGSTLFLGITLRLASYAGMMMMTLLYLASVPSENNPIIDEHVIYFLVLLGLSLFTEHSLFSLYNWWTNLSLVKKFPILK